MLGRAFFLTVVGVTFSLNCQAQAHDATGVANPRFPTEARFTAAQMKKLMDAAPDDDTRYVYQSSLRWTPGRTLSGCFINGSSSQKDLVEQAVDAMLKGKNVNIYISFRADGQYRSCAKDTAGFYNEDVRVEFDGPDGCAAELGTVAKRRTAYSNGYIVAKNPSVFLGAGCQNSSTTKHEILHVLSFHHEHQKPGNTCKFKYDVIARKYGWDETTVKHNFNALEASSAYRSSIGFDNRSIMRYSFGQDVLEGKDCVGTPGPDLTDTDWAGLRSAYPMSFNPDTHRKRIAKRSSIAKTNIIVLDGAMAELGTY